MTVLGNEIPPYQACDPRPATDGVLISIILIDGGTICSRNHLISLRLVNFTLQVKRCDTLVRNLSHASDTTL